MRLRAIEMRLKENIVVLKVQGKEYEELSASEVDSNVEHSRLPPMDHFPPNIPGLLQSPD